ncbi:MAG: hypothetical protein GXP63_06965 [DPANN group archaeon]|nr:hypothetical protein [DPANN group archaeon]
METRAYPENQCIVCDEIITNPICPDCLGQQFKAWLGAHRRTLLLKMQKEVYGFGKRDERGTACVICSKPMHVCPHCLAKAAQRVIDGEDDIELQSQFMTHFNWNLWGPPIGI